MKQDADIISTYSRKQAIEDGVLVDVSESSEAKEAGFQFPVALTQAVHGECVALTKAAEKAGNDVQGRLWDILWMLKQTIKRGGKGDTLNFKVYVVRDRVRPTLTRLKAVCGPGDSGEPVITVMFPEEE